MSSNFHSIHFQTPNAMKVRNLFKITVIYFTETLFRAHMYAKRAQGKHVGASSMCPLHYCINLREERREFWAACHSFYKVDPPPSPNVKRTRGQGRGEEGPERKKPNAQTQAQEQNTTVPSPGRPSATICSHGDGLQDGKSWRLGLG